MKHLAGNLFWGGIGFLFWSAIVVFLCLYGACYALSDGYSKAVKYLRKCGNRMNDYRVTITTTMIVSAPNVVKASQVAKPYMTDGDRCGAKWDSKDSQPWGYRVTSVKTAISLPKIIKGEN